MTDETEVEVEEPALPIEYEEPPAEEVEAEEDVWEEDPDEEDEDFDEDLEEETETEEPETEGWSRLTRQISELARRGKTSISWFCSVTGGVFNGYSSSYEYSPDLLYEELRWMNPEK